MDQNKSLIPIDQVANVELSIVKYKNEILHMRLKNIFEYLLKADPNASAIFNNKTDDAILLALKVENMAHSLSYKS